MRNWALLYPAELHWAVGHLFSANASELLHLTITSSTHKPSLPFPVLKSFPQGILTLLITVPWILCPGLFSSCVMTSGCQQAMTAGTDGSPGWWWLPYVTSFFWVGSFFKCFSFHRSSRSVFCSLKQSEQHGRGDCRWGWRGSDVMPINTFQCRADIQSQLEVYLSLNDYCGVKDCKVKMTPFYCQKADRR